MTITYVGANAANGTSVTIPLGHQAGDLIVMLVYRNGSTGAPTPPNDWLYCDSGSGTTNWLGIYWLEASSASMTSGTWTNATQLVAAVYRPDTDKRLVLTRAAATGGTAGSGGNITYTGLAQMATPTDAWVIGGVGHRSVDTDCQVAPTGMTNRVSLAGGSAGEIALHDSNGTDVDWPSTTYTLTAGTSSGFRTIVAQMAEMAIAASGSGGGTRIHPLLGSLVS
ncbi:MAG: hypothetical protein JNL58_04495 [Planctomyces sp.]|nr:hypothetical protein [Planctomyces sp.]